MAMLEVRHANTCAGAVMHSVRNSNGSTRMPGQLT
eukprot:CAMPEP_0198216406 /NCGR_PEP_ID=MMETSP1445-20131203/57308_1 /TAXON_ID=36898 /ORGANISM="Pyramimonas sp., Strain CCMP2087" /LENGTH=34 /DNA_ID= /DNA_START= /DNA_END= /DNA_ORIENTATION=